MKKLLFIMVLGLLLGLKPAAAQNYIEISKEKLTLSLIDEATGKVVKTYPVAVAAKYGPKLKKGDGKTPEGTFKLNQILYSKNLTHDFRDGKGPIKGAYGPWFLRIDVPPEHVHEK